MKMKKKMYYKLEYKREKFIVMTYEKMVKVVGILSVEKQEYFLVFLKHRDINFLHGSNYSKYINLYIFYVYIYIIIN